MSRPLNLTHRINQHLPPYLAELTRQVGEVAARQGLPLYLVGGVVRDLLLGRPTRDIDLVVEGDAIGLAEHLLAMLDGRITVHPRFRTASLRWNNWRLDLATARAETYSRPGALPTVTPGSLADDLRRRDFTINAMAVYLRPERYGQLIDRFGGRTDLAQGLIRVLHDASYVDDATRIWRTLRYEQRLDFQIEERTLAALRRDLDYLRTVSGDRIRRELELVLREAEPEKVLRRAEELGVLARLHPALRADEWLADRFRRARQVCGDTPPSPALYLALMAYRLGEGDITTLASYLKLPRALARVMRDSAAIRLRSRTLGTPGLRPSRTYAVLHGYAPVAIQAAGLASDSPDIARNINLYLERLRYIRPTLNGDDLLALGVPPGPAVREVSERLRAARLDGRVSTRRGEESLVRRWLQRWQA